MFGFYEEQIKRRQFPSSLTETLFDDMLKHVGNSTFSLTKYKGKEVGSLQIIRAPFGMMFAQTQGENPRLVSRDIGLFGPSVRRFNIGGFDLLSRLDDQELFDYYSRLRDANGLMPVLYTPAEEKLLAEGKHLQRAAPIHGQIEAVCNGKPVACFWGYGEVNEHTRFAIDPELNPSVFVETLTHLLASALDPQFDMDYNRNNRVYITYGDLPRLYTWAGFQPIDASITVGKGTDEEKLMTILLARGSEHIDALLKFTRAYSEADNNRLREIRAAAVHFMQK